MRVESAMTLRFSWVLSFLVLSAAAIACSVPVFRYALEHWQADPFQVILLHRGNLTEAQEAAVQDLEAEKEARANVLLRRLDLTQPVPPDLAALARQIPAEENAWLMARFPASTGIRAAILSAPFTPAALANLIDSPVRQELVKRLSEGESAVWLLLTSGDAAADDAAEKLLTERLEYLAGVMALPKLDESDIANGLVSVPEEDLRLDFSVLRVNREDPAETSLVSMLLHSEEGLLEEEETMVFPVFGQGRALYALVGAGIRHETIESAAAFLVGKCSCQVKEQNPGVDLLMVADWTAAGQASPTLDRDLPSLQELAPELAPETVTTKPKPQTADSASSPQNPNWIWLLAVGLVVLGLAAAKRAKK
jgi:hypothetical protein